MTLKIQTQEDEQRQLAVTIEVDEKRIDKAMRAVARKESRRLRIPGFRPGKAPYGVVKGIIGVEALRQDALNDILPKVFNEALEQIEVEPYAQPSLDDVEFEPLVLKMTVPLEPVVELGDYRAMRREIEPVEVKDEAVDEAIDVIRQQNVSIETVERAAGMGDEVTISGVGYLGDDETDIIFREDEFPITLEEGAIYAGTTIAEDLVGLSADEEKTFTVTFPDEFEDDDELAGKVATFTITVNEVRERVLPELNDEFAAEQPGDYETLEGMREVTRERLQTQAEEQFKSDLLDDAVKEMLENVEEMNYPPGAVEDEINSMIQDMKQRIEQSGWDWPAYLQSRGETEESLREDYETNASERVENRLIFSEFLKQEKLELSDVEVSLKVEERMADYDETMRGFMRPFLEGDGGIMVRQEVLMEKVHDRLVAILKGEAPEDVEAAAKEAEEAAQVKLDELIAAQEAAAAEAAAAEELAADDVEEADDTSVEDSAETETVSDETETEEE